MSKEEQEMVSAAPEGPGCCDVNKTWGSTPQKASWKLFTILFKILFKKTLYLVF